MRTASIEQQLVIYVELEKVYFSKLKIYNSIYNNPKLWAKFQIFLRPL